MTNWVEMARGQAVILGVAVRAGGGSVAVETPWEVIVELRSPEDRVVVARFAKSSGRWRFH